MPGPQQFPQAAYPQAYQGPEPQLFMSPAEHQQLSLMTAKVTLNNSKLLKHLKKGLSYRLKVTDAEFMKELATLRKQYNDALAELPEDAWQNGRAAHPWGLLDTPIGHEPLHQPNKMG